MCKEGGPIEKYKMREGGSEKKSLPPSHILLNGIALIIKSDPADFHDNRISSQGARAASVLSTQSRLTPFEK